MGVKKRVVEVICANCDKVFFKSVSEFNRSEKLGKRHFCCMSCTQRKYNKEHPNLNPNMKGLRAGNRRDEYSRFRWFLLRVKQRRARQGSTNLTLAFLKELWEQQDGKCPFTGFALFLPRTSGQWDKDALRIRRASLDRIDASKGYLQGNVRYVSGTANLARSRITDEELIEFCRAVVENCDG